MRWTLFQNLLISLSFILNDRIYFHNLSCLVLSQTEWEVITHTRQPLSIKSEKAFQETIEDVDLESFTGVKQAGGATSLARYKEELLKLLNENTDRYSADNINRIKSLLTSRNLAVENRMRNYLKRYDNQVSVDLLDTLAILSANLIKGEAPQESPDPVLWFGWHAE